MSVAEHDIVQMLAEVGRINAADRSASSTACEFGCGGAGGGLLTSGGGTRLKSMTHFVFLVAFSSDGPSEVKRVLGIELRTV